MRVGLLGPLVLDAGAGPLPISGARLRALLAYLALDAGRAVRPQALADALWAEAPPADQRNALQSLVSRLRGVLGDPALLTFGPAGYRLAVEAGAVDTARFDQLARSGRHLHAQGRPAQAAAALREALALWRGPALADVREAPFADAEARRLERARLVALEDRIEADLALGAGPELIAELESLTARHPLHERLHAQLIRALAAGGRGAEALAAYQRLRARLADTFGSDPGPQLRAAHLAVLRGELPAPPGHRTPPGRQQFPGHRTPPDRQQFPGHRTPPDRQQFPGHRTPPGRQQFPGHRTLADQPPPQRPEPQRPPPQRSEPRRARPPGNLDAPLTSFVGREDDIHRVAELLGRARLVTLVGPGGSGKTRLATTVGRRLTPSGGVWFAALAPAGPADVPRAVLDALRTREADLPKSAAAPARRPGTPEEILDRLTEVLTHDDPVLVLDNCEHVIEAAAALAGTLLGRCPGLRVLATSREPLRIDGENLHPVLPLELPEPGSTPEQARACAAVRLFHDRAAAVCPGFAEEDGSPAAAVEICRRLDGLPLAIELAAAQLRTLPAEVVAARLDDRFRLLTRGSRTALPRHQTLRAVVAWSWKLLAADERALLERLSVAPGSFTEDAAQAVGGLGVPHAGHHPGDHDALTRDVRELLAALVDKSLLHPLGAAATGEPRYRMLETIREYGLEQLTRRGQDGAARERHCGFFLALAETAEPRLRTRDQLRWLARLSAERDDLLAAIRWAVESGDAATAVRFGAALCWFWSMRGYPPESLDLLERVLEVPGPADPAARALVVATYEVGTESIGRPEDRAAAFGRIEAAMVGVDPGVHPLLELARLAAAIAGPQPPPRPPDPPGPSDPPCPSDFPGPSDFPCPSDFPGPSDPPGPSDFPCPSDPPQTPDFPGPSEFPVLSGSPGSPGSPGLPGFPDGECKDPSSGPFTLLVRGLLTLHTGDVTEARGFLAHALAGFEALGERWGMATALSTLGSLRRRCGDLADALAMNERATRYFQELGMREDTVDSDVQAALMRAQAGDADGARRQLAGLLEEVARAGWAEPRAVVCLGLAQLEWRAGRREPARAHALAALDQAPGGQPVPSHLTALLLGVLAQLDAADGLPGAAVRRLDHPAVHLVLTWNSAVAARIAVAAADIELCRGRPGEAALLLGAADLLRGSDDLGDTDVRRIAGRATADLGAAGFTSAHAAGAAMARTEARDLLSAIITSPSPAASPSPSPAAGPPGQ
ncbi:BTAD domain-containing putative transcriptional regulator [Kitasatospora sp. NPDC091276]|uniref:AfsR/SARP family transcriptional regulator n=1 Tax=Kitasatospora sp. NPDC091276 TaxID=3155300 RepID=UPI00342A2CA9